MISLWLMTVTVMTMIGQHVNLALHRSYTLMPAPNYPLCTDPDDRIQLTDGKYTQGYFWTQKSTVGWRNVSPVIVVVDLGRHAPIAGASFNTAAGVAGVRFPLAVFVLASVDGKSWHEVGDLVAASNTQNGPPPSQGYAVHRFWTDRWQTHGRFVAFVVIPQGAFCFVDEVEVYKGDESWLSLPLPGKGVSDLKLFAQSAGIKRCLLRRLASDRDTLERLISKAPIEKDVKTALLNQLSKLKPAPPSRFSIGEPSKFQTVLPFNFDQHKYLFQLQAQLCRAEGVPPFAVWIPASPYDPLPYLTDKPVPPKASHTATLTLMRNETRPIAINIVNARERSVSVSVKVNGLPPQVSVRVHHSVWTDTKEGVPIAAALPELREEERFHVAPGMIEQVWLSVKADKMAPSGEHEGCVSFSTDAGDEIEVPLRLIVLPVSFPDRPSLHLGGWDYTDVDERYGVNLQNRDAFIAHLRERFVDIPWASRFVMPPGKFDEAGDMVEKPDTTAFDRWLERWKGASRYYVFLSVSNSFEGSKVGTPDFERKVAAWIRFWWRHARKHGLTKGQFGILLVDEPHTPQQDALTIAWAKVIKKAAPEVVIWVDPTWRDPRKMNPHLPEVVDILCPNRVLWLQNKDAYDKFYLSCRDKGKRLASYSCSGPSKLLDPYAYYRLQAWHCFAIGADEMFFWAFGDNVGNSCWNAYLDPRNCYTPLFLAPDSVTAAKHMEAIRDGVQDYEVLTMLRQAVEQAKGRKLDTALIAEAEQLLTDGVRRVLEPIGVNELRWHVDKDRTVADKVRKQALQLLLRLTDSP